jgi:DNA-binding response OmpR family regulator
MKVLYIEDNRLHIASIKKLLGSTYLVDFACTGQEGIESARQIQHSLILLGLSLPDMPGHAVCQELRRANVIAPLLVLSSRKDPETSVKLLNYGADDYMTRPFEDDVLRARVAALLRRGQNLTDEKIIDVHDLTMNITRRQVWRSGALISLRRKEFDILEYMVVNHGRALTRSIILDNVWESGTEGWNNTIDVHIKHLRDKIDRPFGKALIKTAYGIGYILDDS